MPENPTIRFKLSDYFKPGRIKTAVSLGELVNDTNSFSQKNSPGCLPTLTKSDPPNLYLQYNVKCDAKESDPNGHDVKIRFDLEEVTPGAKAKDLDVFCSCTCPAELWWGSQWNMHMRDALEGEPRPLLTAPTERLDLRHNFVVCKHIGVVSRRILPAVQHNIDNILRKRDVAERSKTPPPAKPGLEDKLRKMRERQKKAPVVKDQNTRVRQQLEKGIQNRDNPNVIKRDAPATPEEKKRIPVLPPESVPAPGPDAPEAPITPAAPPAPPQKKKTIMHDLLDDIFPDDMNLDEKDKRNMKKLYEEEE